MRNNHTYAQTHARTNNTDPVLRQELPRKDSALFRSTLTLESRPLSWAGFELALGD